MKPNNLLIYALIIILFIWMAGLCGICLNTRRYVDALEDTFLDLIITDSNQVDLRILEWHLLIDAIIEKESRGKEDAIGKTNDVGVLQITPIYVEEVNRILGEQKYTLKDRYDKYKSIEMFNIMNDRYNPDKCFYKAIQLHNPKAPRSYRLDILKNYYRLLKNNKIIW